MPSAKALTDLVTYVSTYSHSSSAVNFGYTNYNFGGSSNLDFWLKKDGGGECVYCSRRPDPLYKFCPGCGAPR